jgi:hypothetical protein
MWGILLVVGILVMFGGWAYEGRRGGNYGNPMGMVALALLITFAVLLYRGIL